MLQSPHQPLELRKGANRCASAPLACSPTRHIGGLADCAEMPTRFAQNTASDVRRAQRPAIVPATQNPIDRAPRFAGMAAELVVRC